MASVTEQTAAATNGGAAPSTIPVENPAAGEVIANIPALSEEDLAQMVKRAREAQPGWEALGFEGRGRIVRRAQKWMVDNIERVIETVVSEAGKTYEDAQLADYGYTV